MTPSIGGREPDPDLEGGGYRVAVGPVAAGRGLSRRASLLTLALPVVAIASFVAGTLLAGPSRPPVPSPAARPAEGEVPGPDGTKVIMAGGVRP